MIIQIKCHDNLGGSYPVMYIDWLSIILRFYFNNFKILSTGRTLKRFSTGLFFLKLVFKCIVMKDNRSIAEDASLSQTAGLGLID